MTHAQRIKRLEQSISLDLREAADMEEEVRDGRAAEYEQRVDFEKGYVASLAADRREHAERTQQKVDELKAKYKR